MMHVRWASLIAFIAAPAVAGDLQPWPDVSLTVPAGSGWQVYGQVIGRLTLREDRAAQGEYRLHVGRTIAPGLTLWAGYGHIDSTFDGHITQREDQVIEQLNWSGIPVGPGRLSFRTRLEQRFSSASGGTAWRVRQQVRATVPIGGASLVAWAEPFVSLNKTAFARTRLDQLRYFGGVAVPVARHVDLETGLLRQEIHRVQGDIANTAVPIILNVRL